MKRSLLFFLTGFFFLSKLFAQDIETEKKRAFLLYSPFHTIYLHYQSLGQEEYNLGKAALTLHPYAGLTQKQKEELAIQLKQIIDGNGLWIDEENIPKEINYLDSLSKKNRYTPFPNFPEIYVEKVGNQWFYSLETVASIPKLYVQTFPFESNRLYEFLKRKTGQKKYLGLIPVHYIGLAFLLISPFVFYWIFNLTFGFIFVLIFRRFTAKERRKKQNKRLARPLSLFLTFYLISEITPIFQLPAILSYYIITVIRIALPVFAVILAVGLINLVAYYFEKLAQTKGNIFYLQIIPFIQTTLNIISIIIGLGYFLNVLHLNVTALLAGLSIGGLAIALAAQETIKNLFGSVTIFFDRPFKVGDWIQGDKIDGEVEEIGFRSTKIRSFHNSVIYVPNGKIADMTIDNYGMRDFRRFKTTLGLRYDTPPVVIQTFVQSLESYVLQHPFIRKDLYIIRLNDFAEYAINVLFYIYIISSTWQEECRIREEIMMTVLEIAEQLGIHFAFPTQTLAVETYPQNGDLKPEYDTNQAMLEEKIKAYLQEKSQK